MPSIALAICIVGIWGLFVLDRDKTYQNSPALWLPVAWLLIVGSRPISAWLGMGSGGETLDATLDGSPIDAIVFAVLLMAGLLVLFHRKHETAACLRSNGPIIIYFGYCLLSVLWSSYPVSAFKRWTKDLGDLVIVLVIVTDPRPTIAIRQVFSRVGFILLPTSVYLIRYSYLGRGYDPEGNLMNTGVTTNKNTLGLITFVVGLGAFWHFMGLLRGKRGPSRRRHLIAQGTLVAFAVAVLFMAHSSTAVACFILGSGLLFVTSLRAVSGKPRSVHRVVGALALFGALTMLFDLKGAVLQALGRDEKLTGRTEIWKEIIPMAKNPIIGAGFESFWNEANLKLRYNNDGYMFRGLNSAHNGYLDVYLNLGWVGVCLIVLILVSSYVSTVRSFLSNKELSPLLLAYIITSMAYSMTEAGFRVLCPMWICLLLAAVAGRYRDRLSRTMINDGRISIGPQFTLSSGASIRA